MTCRFLKIYIILNIIPDNKNIPQKTADILTSCLFYQNQKNSKADYNIFIYQLITAKISSVYHTRVC